MLHLSKLRMITKYGTQPYDKMAHKVTISFLSAAPVQNLMLINLLRLLKKIN
jgi:hypothetical protein